MSSYKSWIALNIFHILYITGTALLCPQLFSILGKYDLINANQNKCSMVCRPCELSFMHKCLLFIEEESFVHIIGQTVKFLNLKEYLYYTYSDIHIERVQ